MNSERAIERPVAAGGEELRRGKKRRKIKRAAFICAMMAFPVLHFVLFFVVVNGKSIFMCFQHRNYLTNSVEWYGLNNFVRVFEEFRGYTSGSNGVLAYAVKNSLEYFAFNQFILLPFTVIFSYFFFKRMPGYKVFRLVFFLPSLIPGVAMPLLYGFMLDSSFGVVNDLLKAIGLGSLIPVNGWFGSGSLAQAMILVYLAWCGCGTNIVLYAGNLNRIPAEIFESARLDGITMRAELAHLVLPLIWPTVSIVFISGCMTIFNVYIPAMMLTQGGPGGKTMTIAYILLNWTTGGEQYLSAAAGIVFSMVGIPFVLLVKFGMERLAPKVEF